MTRKPVAVAAGISPQCECRCELLNMRKVDLYPVKQSAIYETGLYKYSSNFYISSKLRKMLLFLRYHNPNSFRILQKDCKCFSLHAVIIWLWRWRKHIFQLTFVLPWNPGGLSHQHTGSWVSLITSSYCQARGVWTMVKSSLQRPGEPWRWVWKTLPCFLAFYSMNGTLSGPEAPADPLLTQYTPLIWPKVSP